MLASTTRPLVASGGYGASSSGWKLRQWQPSQIFQVGDESTDEENINEEDDDMLDGVKVILALQAQKDQAALTEIIYKEEKMKWIKWPSMLVDQVK